MSIESVMSSNILSSVIPFSSCLQSCPAWGSSSISQFFTSGGQRLEFQLQHQSFQWIFRTDFLSDFLVWSPCSPRDSQESSPTPQFKSINSSVPSFFIVQPSHPHMTTGKNIALTRWTFVGKIMSLLFNMLSRLVVAFLPSSKYLLNHGCSHHLHDFGDQKNKVCHYFHCFPIYLPWSDGTRCHDLSFLNVELEANFFPLLLHFHQEAL